MIRIKKGFVTFNKYARNFNSHNEMKTTITRHAGLSFSLAWNTPRMHTYKMKYVRRKRCSLRYTYRRNCGSTTEMKHNKTDVLRWIFTKNQDNCTWLDQADHTFQFEVAVLRLVPPAAKAIMWLTTVLTPLSSAENTCFSFQSLVLVITFRCHSNFHFAFPTFWGLVRTLFIH